MQPLDLDKTDRQILNLLQTEPGINAAAVGEAIGLSQSACWRRIQRLRDAGVIRDQPAVTLGYGKFLQTLLEVQECYLLMGTVDFLLRIVAEDIKAYERFFFEKLSQVPGVQEITSNIALSRIKHTTVLPL